MSFADWETVAANNSTALGVNIAEGCPPSNVNNAIRAVMADVRTAINPVMDSFLSSTSLSSARSALGVPATTDAVNAISALTPAANKLPYYTGTSSAALTDFTSFARTLLDDGDAATARTTLAALGLTSATFGAGTVAIRITLGDGNTLLIQGGSGTLGANTTGTVTFPTAYSVAPVAMVNGGGTAADNEGDIRNTAAATTTGIAIANTSGQTDTYTWFAIGKL